MAQVKVLRRGIVAALALWLCFELEGVPAARRSASLSPELHFLLTRIAAAESAFELGRLQGVFVGAASASDEATVGVLVRTSSVLALRARGVAVNSVLGDVVTARVSLAQLRAMRDWPEVIYVEGPGVLSVASDPLQPVAVPELDSSVKQIGADRLHRKGITGKGVVVGVVDTGVDWTHLDFRLDRDGDGFEESTRLLGIWDQTHSGERPAGFSYGVEYTRSQLEHALAANDESLIHQADANPTSPSHGTHALGIVGGDGSSSSLRLIGAAPEAELVAVKSPLAFDAVVDGVNYIFNTAGGRPAVASLSLGSHLGAHDGTSNFERALDTLAQAPGRVIVVAAGNEGDDRIHVGGTVPSTSKAFVTFDLPDSLGKSRFSFDFWYDGKDPIYIKVTGPSGQPVGGVPTGELLDASGPDGGVFIDNASGGPNPNNGLHEALITVYGGVFGSDTSLQRGGWIIELHAPRLGARFDGWALDVPFSSSNADHRSTVRLPATARGVIAVGAYVSRTQWPSFVGSLQRFENDGSIGRIAAFSSLGPTRDGRIKPDLAAPGSMVASALSRASLPLVSPAWVMSDGVHMVNRGTSFAAPHVSGAAALLLQTDPTLTTAQVLQLLAQHALHDEFTSFVANPVWGFGKLNLDFDRATPPPTAHLGALDENGNRLLDDAEILAAVQLWITGNAPSGGAEFEINDALILLLIGLWVQQAPLDL